MTRHNVFATAEEIERLKGMVGAPMIALQCGDPPDPRKEAHRIALAHGLPEIRGYYGVDLKTGEFLS